MHLKHPVNRLNALLFLLLPLLMTLAMGRVEAAGFRLIYTNDNLGEMDGCG